MAVASGLCVGDSSVDLPRSMLLIDWMKGLFGDADTCKDVVRLVICGACASTASVAGMMRTLFCWCFLMLSEGFVMQVVLKAI